VEIMHGQDSVASILEADARGETAEIFAEIRKVLGTSVVNLIWRNLATLPDALRWTWSTVRPLYLGAAAPHAEAVRRTLSLPALPPLSVDTLSAAGLDRAALAAIGATLDSYHHTNALALVVLSALLERYDPSPGEAARPSATVSAAGATELAALPLLSELTPDVQRLIAELNGFGEDTASFLIASMYRHLAYWPPYLAIVRTLLAPLQADARLHALTNEARMLGRAHGRALVNRLAPDDPPASLEQALASCRLFVEHPIARMTGICALARRATPE
jgi:hypothetical protein